MKFNLIFAGSTKIKIKTHLVPFKRQIEKVTNISSVYKNFQHYQYKDNNLPKLTKIIRIKVPSI